MRKLREAIKASNIKTLKSLKSYREFQENFTLNNSFVTEKELAREYLKTLGIYIHPEEDLYNNILSFKVFHSKTKYLEEVPLNTWEGVLLKIFLQIDQQKTYDI